MIISLGSDHAGFEQKDALAAFLVDEGHDVVDRGPENDDRVDYPDYALRVARDVAEGAADYGILVCGTGIGMAMAADKVPGVRAANIVRVFLSTAFGGGRHAQRVEKIMALDEL